MLPDFLYIGGARCGSTWVYSCLKEHPEIFVPNLKEIQFFNNKQGRFKRGIGWYKTFFNDAKSFKTAGEVSPTYLACKKCPKRIYEFLPDVKLIVSLRNPVEMVYSRYLGRIDRGDLCIDDDIIESGKIKFNQHYTPYIEEGFYYKHLCNYLRYFPKENFLFLVFDDLKKDSKIFIKRIFDFLQVDTDFKPSVINKKIHSGGYSEGRRLINILFSPFRYIVDGRVLDLDFPRKFLVHNFFSEKGKKPKMRKDQRNRLIELYREDISSLSQLIDRDLSNWIKES